MAEPVPVLPLGFDPSNPNAAKNIAAANKAAERVHNAVSRKCNLLSEMIQQFGGTDVIRAALRKNDSLDKDDPSESIDEFIRDVDEAEQEHRDASEALCVAVA